MKISNVIGDPVRRTGWLPERRDSSRPSATSSADKSGPAELRGGDRERMKNKKIVIIEDEPDILEVLVFNLRREGFDVVTADNGSDGLRVIRRERPDVVLLDLLLPNVDGLDICRHLRSQAETRALPIIMLTAKGEESDVVLGLGVGADDYMVKPFSPKEVVARVKALLRRTELPSEPAEGPKRLARGPLVIDPERHQVLLDGARQTFTPTEFRLLQTLAGSPGRVFTRDQLVDRVIGPNAAVTDRNIDVHVRSVRKKLGRHRDLIETIRGIGYTLREESGSA